MLISADNLTLRRFAVSVVDLEVFASLVLLSEHTLSNNRITNQFVYFGRAL